jgi:cysteine desulfurase family protein (TIGR01976 family)
VPLDLNFVRAQFPAFGEPTLAGFTHCENAGGSYASGQTIALLERYYRQTKVQPYYSFAASARAGEQMDSAKARLAAWLNVNTDEIHFGPSTSQNTYTLAQALRRYLEPGDEVIVTNQDHEANVGAYARLASEGITVREWKVNPRTAELERRDLETLLGPRTRLVAFTHCSNIVGSINAVREITDLVHRAGAWAFVDGVAFAPHGLPDLAELGVDAYYFSLYKVYGPHLGALFLKREINATLPNQGHYFNEALVDKRFTPAGPDHAQVAAVNGVIDYMDAIANHHGQQGKPIRERAAAVRSLFRSHESVLLQPLLEFLASQACVRLVGRAVVTDRAPTVSFTASGQRSVDIAAALARANIGVGVGHCYAFRLLQALGIDTDDGVVRLSFVHYTSSDDIDRLIHALQRCLN